MIKKKVFIITVLALLVIIAAQTVIIMKPSIIGRHEVTTAENAIIIAKAAILQKYGEAELQRVSDNLLAYRHYEQPNYWLVSERNTYDDSPHILVRRSDGKVILKWK